MPGRCLTMTRCSLDRIPLLLVIDAAVLVVGWLAGTWFLEAFASLWRGGTLDDVARAAFDPFAEDGDAALAKALDDRDWQVRQNAEDLVNPRLTPSD